MPAAGIPLTECMMLPGMTPALAAEPPTLTSLTRISPFALRRISAHADVSSSAGRRPGARYLSSLLSWRGMCRPARDTACPAPASRLSHAPLTCGRDACPPRRASRPPSADRPTSNRPQAASRRPSTHRRLRAASDRGDQHAQARVRATPARLQMCPCRGPAAAARRYLGVHGGCPCARVRRWGVRSSPPPPQSPSGNSKTRERQ